MKNIEVKQVITRTTVSEGEIQESSELQYRTQADDDSWSAWTSVPVEVVEG